MSKRLRQIKFVIIMIFVAIGGAVVMDFLHKRLGGLVDLILIGGFILFLAIGLMLRNLRQPG